MGFKCDRCEHEWVPRTLETEPRVCPKCKSPYWNVPRKKANTYEEFRDKIRSALDVGGEPMTWTEVRTETGLPQLFPNNQWVRRLETDIGLERSRDAKGIMRWKLP